MRTTLPLKLQQHRNAVACLFLLTVLFSCFCPFIIGNKTFLESARQAASVMPYGSYRGKTIQAAYSRTKDPGGAGWVEEPFLALIKQEYVHAKTLPFWNPYQAFGTPLAANMQSQAFQPLFVLLSLYHTPRTYNLYILIRLFTAGITAYFYLRLFVSFVPALAAGVMAMLGGYYLLYVTMQHLSVEVLLPALLLTGEHLIRTPLLRTVGWFAFVVFLVLVGGMPESSLLVLATSFIYIIFRVLTDERLRSSWYSILKMMLFGTCTGFCFSAILLLPFRQYLRYSYDIHQFVNTGSYTGLAHDLIDLSIFTYLFPFIMGPSWDNELRNYTGLLAFFLFMLSVLSLQRRGDERSRKLNALTCFFGLLAIGVVMKRYGFRPVNALGILPFFNLVNFPKYEESLLSISAAMLCGVGMERLISGRVSPTRQAVALALAVITIPLALTASRNVVAKQILASSTSSNIVLWTFLVPTILLLFVAALLIGFHSLRIRIRFEGEPIRKVLACCVLTFLTCEAVFNYVVPSYYFWNEIPSVSSNPYGGAPYIDFLKKRAGLYRIFGEAGILYPNWSSAFGLFDIRSLDAMFYKKYFPFLRVFFRSGAGLADPNELSNRFTGAGDYRFQDLLQQRLLQLSSTKYVVTTPNIQLQRNNIVNEILKQNEGKLTRGRERQINSQPLTIAGVKRFSLGEHPPYDRLPYRFHVDPDHQILHFSYGIDPAAFAACGDGVEFVVEVKSSSGQIDKLLAHFIDPRHVLNERRWMDASLDLTHYVGKDVEVLLTTNGGPKGDTCADWAFWSNFYFKDDGKFDFQQIYANEVNIFEYSHVLPRAAIFYRASLRSGEGEVLKTLADPSFSAFDTVLLNGLALNAKQREWLTQLNQVSSKPITAAKITAYNPQEVIIDAALDRPGILVLNDSDYPGWKVTVDGVLQELVSANYIFRGVLLRPGQHTIRFVYEPRSVVMGAFISLSSFFCFAILGLVRLVNRQRASWGRSLTFSGPSAKH